MTATQHDIPFATDDAHRFLPWLICMMVAMAALLLCLAASINGWVVDRHGSYANSFTVDVPALSDDLPNKLPKLREALQKIPGVTSVVPLSEEKIRDMLKPWFGSGELSQDLPLPAVFDVTLSPALASPPNYAELQKSLNSIIAGTEVDAHERWVASFSDFSSAVQGMVGGLAALIICVMAIMIAFACRASLKLHSYTVHLLHSIGAEDSYIARQFQREAFLLALRGALSGCVIAGIVYWFAGRYVASLKAAMIPSLSLGVVHIALLLLMPLGCGVVAWVAARLTVRQQLEQVL